MPPLSEMLKVQNLKGFEAVETDPRPQEKLPGVALGGNAYIRCPLPPFSATPDTLRQFNESGKTPTRRVIPLPIATQVMSGTVTHGGVVITGGGGGSSGSSTGTDTDTDNDSGIAASLPSALVVINSPPLLAGATFRTTVQMAKSFQLLQLNATQPLEVRLYSTLFAQVSDIARKSDTAVPFEVSQGVITDVILDTPPYQWNWQNRIAANADSPQSTNIYVTVVNPAPTLPVAAATITIVYLPLES